MSTRRHRCLSLTLATLLVAASCAPLGLVPSAALAAGTHTITAAASPTATAAASPTATAAATAAAPTVTTNPLSGGVSPLLPVPTTTTPTTVVTNATTAAPGSSSISSASVIAIAVGAIIVLGGISLFIWRDARRRAPVATRAGPSGDGRGRAGSKPPAKPPAKPRKLSPAERRRRKRGRAR